MIDRSRPSRRSDSAGPGFLGRIAPGLWLLAFTGMVIWGLHILFSGWARELAAELAAIEDWTEARSGDSTVVLPRDEGEPSPEAGAEEAAPDAPPEPAAGARRPTVIANPAWVTPPDIQFPHAAARAGIETGAVQLRCELLAEGRLGACETLNEQPAGHGFAEAAVAGTRAARLRPLAVDGHVMDTTVEFTARFRLETDEEAAARNAARIAARR